MGDDVHLDPEAFSLLNSQQSGLIDAIDSLRALELGKEIPLPQLIVVGNQNCGKSSVLESISRVRFAVHHDLCTRFPTELILRRASTKQVSVTIKPGKPYPATFGADPQPKKTFLRTSFEPELLPELISEAEVAMGIHHPSNQDTRSPIRAQFSHNILRIEITGPKLLNLSLVDLPGLFESGSRNQKQNERVKVEKIVKKYMKDKHSIMLVVVSGTMDPANQSGPRLARQYDSDGKRTLGILTRVDSSEIGPEQDRLIRCAKNDYVQFELGWHTLRNRSATERQNSTTDAERDALEEDFFSHAPWDAIEDQDKGIEGLRFKLSGLLLDHIKRYLPGLVSDATAARNLRIKEKRMLGVPVSGYRDQRNYISLMAKSFEAITNRALDGKYDDKVFGHLGDDSTLSQDARLRAKIREMNRLFGTIMMEGGRKFNILPNTRNDENRHDGQEHHDTDDADRSHEKGGDTNEERTSHSASGSGSQEHDVFSDDLEASSPGFVGLDEGLLSSVLPNKVIYKYYAHRKPAIISRANVESSVMLYVSKWRGGEGHGDTNSALTRELFKMQTSPWETIVRDHSKALWEAVERFVDLALDQTVHTPIRQKVKEKITNPGLQRLRKSFFAKRREILESHRNIDPSCYDGLINNWMLTAQSRNLAQRLGHWANDKPVNNKETGNMRTGHSQGDYIDQTYTTFPSEMEQFSAARTVNLASLCLEITTINLVNTFTIIAVENCLIPGVRKLFSDTTIGDVSEDVINEIAGDSPATAKRREQLAEEINVLTQVLRVFHEYQGTGIGSIDLEDLLSENVQETNSSDEDI